MDFWEAVRSGFSHYVKFDGRASRPAFWWWVLFSFLVYFAASIIDEAVLGSSGGSQTLMVLAYVVLFLPSLSVAIRRLHDTDRSGWWVLIGLIPIVGAIVLIIFYLGKSYEASNRFGPPQCGEILEKI